MTPKEKAEELVSKIAPFVVGDSYSNLELTNAKKCALVAVDEIELALIENECGWNSEYWQEVKAEIEKL